MQPRGVLTRLMDDEVMESLGHLTIWGGLEKLFECKTLELPDRGNEQNVSRVPAGSYWVSVRYSEKYGWHFHLLGVDGRTFILIHAGNRYTHTKGCILVGTSFKHLDDDGILDVIWSRHTLDKLLKVCPEGFRLFIVDIDK